MSLYKVQYSRQHSGYTRSLVESEALGFSLIRRLTALAKTFGVSGRRLLAGDVTAVGRGTAMIGGAVHRRIRRQAGLAGRIGFLMQASAHTDGSLAGFFRTPGDIAVAGSITSSGSSGAGYLAGRSRCLSRFFLSRTDRGRSPSDSLSASPASIFSRRTAVSIVAGFTGWAPVVAPLSGAPGGICPLAMARRCFSIAVLRPYALYCSIFAGDAAEPSGLILC